MDRAKIFQIIIAVVMLIAMLYGRHVSYPDNVHDLHGLPLVWGTHQLVTIFGPLDSWMVNLTNLAVDLVFWVGLILIAPYLENMLNKE